MTTTNLSEQRSMKNLSTRARNGLRGIVWHMSGETDSRFPTEQEIRSWAADGSLKKAPNIGIKTLREIEIWLDDIEQRDGHQCFRNDWFQILPPSVGVDANWHVTNYADTCVAHCFGFSHSVDGGEDFARRISAALNYCRGISTDRLLASQRKNDGFK